MSRRFTLKDRASLPDTDGVGTRRVVVGVDGSAAARDALTWAAEEAARRQAIALQGSSPSDPPGTYDTVTDGPRPQGSSRGTALRG